MSLKVIILAAGKGTRMLAHLPKVIHPLGGIPLLGHVIHTAQRLAPDEVFVVYSPDLPEVREALSTESVTWIEQSEQKGTGHAALQVAPHLSVNDRVLVLYGDVPLITVETLQYLVDTSPQRGLGLLVAEVNDPTGLGRIIRNADAQIVRIVEHKDANAAQLRLKEINTGIMLMPAQLLMNYLPNLCNNNHQNEYYLTDLVALMVQEKRPIHGVQAFSDYEIQGVNNRWQLARLERYYQELMAKHYSLRGVTIKDYKRFDVRGRAVNISSDVEIDINVVLSGRVNIGAHTYIGPNVTIENSIIGEGVRIEANSVIKDTEVGKQSVIGPFAHLRGGTRLGVGVTIGNFVELKNAELGDEVAAKHLSYLGDATLADGVNIGAGTITCNYDGVKKCRTEIERGAFIGANATLVAPISVGEEAVVAAGTTLTASIAKHTLGIARPAQQEVLNYKKKTEKQ